MSSDDGLRSDARENRERILRIAHEALAADPGASLNSIAKAANVGPGTLYRHFPSRESLVFIVYQQEIEELADLASALLDQYRPLQAFRLWCDRLMIFGRMKRGFADIIDSTKPTTELQGTHNPLVNAVQKLINASIEAGEIHPSTNLDDILTLLAIMWKIPSNSEGEERTRRLLDLIFRGLETTGR